MRSLHIYSMLIRLDEIKAEIEDMNLRGIRNEDDAEHHKFLIETKAKLEHKLELLGGAGLLEN